MAAGGVPLAHDQGVLKEKFDPINYFGINVVGQMIVKVAIERLILVTLQLVVKVCVFVCVCVCVCVRVCVCVSLPLGVNNLYVASCGGI